MDINKTSSEFDNTSTSNLSSDNEPSTSAMLSPSIGCDRNQAIKRDGTLERELNGVKSPNRKKVKSFIEDEGKDQVEEKVKELPPQSQQHMQMKPTTSNPTNGYAVNPSQSHFMIPQHSIHNTINKDTPGNSGLLCMDMNSTIISMNPYLGMVPPDPSSTLEIPPVPSFCSMPMNRILSSVPQKTVKVFSSCTLYPPPLTAPPPSRRERPSGCKTVVVSGLPEKITEDIVKEVFSECGEIALIRMSKMNFCKIRFTSELHVEQALIFSDYRIIIENSDEPAYCGRLHVDFAVSHGNRNRLERLRRNLTWAHRYANIDELLNSSEFETATDGEQVLVGNVHEIMPSCERLITWLDQKERDRRNAEAAFIRLSKEKAKLEEENKLLRDQLQAVTDETISVKAEDDKKNAALLETYHLMQQNYVETQKELEDTLKETFALESKGSAISDRE